jgi:hypothetical protein
MEVALHGRFIIPYKPMPLERVLELELQRFGYTLGPLELIGAHARRRLCSLETGDAFGLPTIHQMQFVGRQTIGGGGLHRKGIPSITYLSRFLGEGAPYASTVIRVASEDDLDNEDEWPGQVALSLEYKRNGSKHPFPCLMTRNQEGFAPEIVFGDSKVKGSGQVSFPGVEYLAKSLAEYVAKLRKEA